MELFYSPDEGSTLITLGEEESGHCVRVLRHKEGDEIFITDGRGRLSRARIVSAAPKSVEAEVIGTEENFGTHPYKLTMAVCPTKNLDRYEWFVEKAVEIGVDKIVPVIGDRSERKVIKTDRLQRLILSATKQSLKGVVPAVCESESVKNFILSAEEDVKLICYCFEGQKLSVKEALAGMEEGSSVAILIGPEGDFSPEEVRLALEKGFKPVHLGTSRLRTETAAIAGVAAVYFEFMK